MERVAVSFCGLWSLKPVDVSNAPASRGPTAYYKPVLATRKPTGEACLPACLFKKTALSVSFVVCRSPGGYPMHRDSFCVTKSRRFYRTKPVLLVLISTTANVALAGLKKKQQPARHEPATVDLGAQRMHSRTPNLRSFSQSLPIIIAPSSPLMLVQGSWVSVAGTHRRAGAQDYRSAGTTNLKRSRPVFRWRPPSASCAGRRSRLSHSLFGWLYKTKPSSRDTVSSYFVVYTKHNGVSRSGGMQNSSLGQNKVRDFHVVRSSCFNHTVW